MPRGRASAARAWRLGAELARATALRARRRRPEARARSSSPPAGSIPDVPDCYYRDAAGRIHPLL
jgi:hypothetical protein